MGIFFTPVRTVAQIRFNGNEVYNIGQSYGKDASTSVEKQIPPGVAPQIGVYGITPEDLAMSFPLLEVQGGAENGNSPRTGLPGFSSGKQGRQGTGACGGQLRVFLPDAGGMVPHAR